MKLNVVFAGLPNVGKSTWMNKICGSHCRTGNWSGVTVEKLEAVIKYQNHQFHFIDLPGFRGFSHQYEEEKITEHFLKTEKIDLIVHVMDASHMRMSLALAYELKKLKIPMIGILSFKDQAENAGIHIQLDKLSRQLGVPLIYTSLHDSFYQKHFFDLILKQIEHSKNYPRNNHQDLNDFTDKEILLNNWMSCVEGSFQTVNLKSLTFDRFLLNSTFGKFCLLFFALSYVVMMFLTGSFLSEIFDKLLLVVNELLHPFMVLLPELMYSFVQSVILSSLGSVISFLPMLFCFYLGLSILEESGLMARIQLMMDHSMRTLYLSGKSFLCFLLSFGCNVLAIEAAATLETEAMKKKTAFLVCFCSCSARLPVYLYLARLVFRNNEFLVLALVYGAGIFLIFLLSVILQFQTNWTLSEQRIIELPSLRTIHLQQLTKKTANHMIEFIKKLIVLIFAMMCLLWFLMRVPSFENSIFVVLAKRIAVLYEPLGFGSHWIYVASLIPGIAAKEAILSTIVLIQSQFDVLLSMDPKVNLIYLIYVCLYQPCIFTLLAIKRRFGKKMMLISIAGTFLASYLFCWLVLQFLIFF